MIVLAVDEQDRYVRLRERNKRGAAARACGETLFADAVGNGGCKHCRQVQVVAHHILPDILRGRIGRVSDHAAHRVGQPHAGRHEHCRRTHGDAREIDGQITAAVVHDPAHPVEAVVALREAKADISALALVLCALLHIEHTAPFSFPEFREETKIPIPRRAPAVKGYEDALGVFAFAQVPHKREPLAAAQQHRLGMRGAELLRRLALRRAIALILALSGQMRALAVQMLRQIPLHRHIHQRLCRAIGRHAVNGCRGGSGYRGLRSFFHVSSSLYLNCKHLSRPLDKRKSPCYTAS